MQLVHITDLHLTSLDGLRPGPFALKRWMSWLSWQRRRRSVHRPPQLNALIDLLRQRSPDAWAITGDLCQIGLSEEVEQARDWLEALDAPERMLLVPGNHDIFARDSIRTVRRSWNRWMASDDGQIDIPTVRRIGPVSLIGVDSTIVTPPGLATGRVGHAGRERLARVLEREQGQFRIVLIHHPALPDVCKRRKALIDAPELKTLLEDAGPGLVLHGHLHANHDWILPSKTRVYCTASASASDAAAARVFGITPHDDDFEVEMELITLDAQGRDRVDQRQSWRSNG